MKRGFNGKYAPLVALSLLYVLLDLQCEKHKDDVIHMTDEIQPIIWCCKRTKPGAYNSII
jgi:hypothetical protein